jgi:hypothetical protein
MSVLGDLATVNSTAFDAVSVTRANAAAGPIMDLPAAASLLQLKAQEMKELLFYILSGNQIGSGSSGPVRSGDANYTLLNNLLTTLG